MKYKASAILVLTICLNTVGHGDEITNILGRVYQNASIIRREPDGISVKHSGGIAKIYFTELPPDVQIKYGYDPASANQYRQNVIKSEQSYYSQVQKKAPNANLSPGFPASVYDIIAVKDKSLKRIDGISAYYSGPFGDTVVHRSVGGLYRIRFSLSNKTDADQQVVVHYGGFFKQFYVTANSRKEGQEISGNEKYTELKIVVNGQEKIFPFNW